MKQYRIKELNGVFTIQSLVSFGIFGKGWEDTDYWGNYGLFSFFKSSLNEYDSLEHAKYRIDQWNENPKYHAYP